MSTSFRRTAMVAATLAVPGAPHAQIPPPPIVSTGFSGPALLAWSAGEVRCGDAIPQWRSPPIVAPAMNYGVSSGLAMTVTFRIDASGRPLGITMADRAFVPGNEDVAPALAAARFAPGVPLTGCSLRFAAQPVPVAGMPADIATAYVLSHPAGSTSRAVWRQTMPADTDCIDPAPAPLVRVFPDFKALAGTPGVAQWTMIGFDLDARGQPVNVAVAGHAGRPALDAAGIAAIRASRFEAGARHGCRSPFWHRAEVLPAPDAPTEEAMRPAGATCPAQLPYVRQPNLIFPEAYRKRSIEGWAIVAFDVAPWGAIGNLRVLAAEPAATFGDGAINVMRNATKPASTTGYVGCVDRVLFKIGDHPPVRSTDQPIVLD